MEQEKTTVKNVYKYTDESVRREIILSKVAQLIENNMLSSVRLEAIARLQEK